VNVEKVWIEYTYYKDSSIEERQLGTTKLRRPNTGPLCVEREEVIGEYCVLQKNGAAKREAKILALCEGGCIGLQEKW
jgi:hypothetical protein